MFSFQFNFVWIIWIIMNFFANFGRVNTISISKIAVKTHKLCVKRSFWYIKRGWGWGGGCQRFCYVTEEGGILLTSRTVTRGEGRPNFRQKQRYVSFEWSLKNKYGFSSNIHKDTRIHWLDRRIVRKQLNTMPTYHYVQNQGKLMMQSRGNDQKPQFGHFFDDFEVKYLQIANFSKK